MDPVLENALLDATIVTGTLLGLAKMNHRVALIRRQTVGPAKKTSASCEVSAMSLPQHTFRWPWLYVCYLRTEQSSNISGSGSVRPSPTFVDFYFSADSQ